MLGKMRSFYAYVGALSNGMEEVNEMFGKVGDRVERLPKLARVMQLFPGLEPTELPDILTRVNTFFGGHAGFVDLCDKVLKRELRTGGAEAGVSQIVQLFDAIKFFGGVASFLSAAIWCRENTHGYKKVPLKGVLQMFLAAAPRQEDFEVLVDCAASFQEVRFHEQLCKLRPEYAALLGRRDEMGVLFGEEVHLGEHKRLGRKVIASAAADEKLGRRGSIRLASPTVAAVEVKQVQGKKRKVKKRLGATQAALGGGAAQNGGVSAEGIDRSLRKNLAQSTPMLDTTAVRGEGTQGTPGGILLSTEEEGEEWESVEEGDDEPIGEVGDQNASVQQARTAPAGGSGPQGDIRITPSSNASSTPASGDSRVRKTSKRTPIPTTTTLVELKQLRCRELNEAAALWKRRYAVTK